jgi:hypothetical protein
MGAALTETAVEVILMPQNAEFIRTRIYGFLFLSKGQHEKAAKADQWHIQLYPLRNQNDSYSSRAMMHYCNKAQRPDMPQHIERLFSRFGCRSLFFFFFFFLYQRLF